jgi:integrase/recombinase XerD
MPTRARRAIGAMLKLRKRHEEECIAKRRAKDPSASEYDSYIRCRCSYHVSGTVGGQFIRRSLKTSDGERAARLVREMEDAGQPTVPDTGSVTVGHAVEAFLADCHAMNRRAATLGKYTHDLQGVFLPWCESKGYVALATVAQVAVVREFRTTWGQNASITRSKKQDRLVTFFGWCERAGWLERNPITSRNLGKIKVQVQPTDYFHPEEMAAILAACETYKGDRWGRDSGSAGKRLRALTLLMRWTGLRIGDAITLRRDRLVRTERGGDAVFLYTQKTGTHVYCPIPPAVAAELREVPPGPVGRSHPDYFFWSGNGFVKSAVADWQRSYKKLFRLAGLEKRSHPHMFRDTFAVECLLAGIPLEKVSILLGHSSVKITEKHYKPWVRALQHQLEDDVMQAWGPQTAPDAPEPGTVLGGAAYYAVAVEYPLYHEFRDEPFAVLPLTTGAKDRDDPRLTLENALEGSVG